MVHQVSPCYCTLYVAVGVVLVIKPIQAVHSLAYFATINQRQTHIYRQPLGNTSNGFQSVADGCHVVVSAQHECGFCQSRHSLLALLVFCNHARKQFIRRIIATRLQVGITKKQGNIGTFGSRPYDSLGKYLYRLILTPSEEQTPYLNSLVRHTFGKRRIRYKKTVGNSILCRLTERVAEIIMIGKQLEEAINSYTLVVICFHFSNFDVLETTLPGGMSLFSML